VEALVVVYLALEQALTMVLAVAVLVVLKQQLALL
jgi:hypothetical protein